MRPRALDAALLALLAVLALWHGWPGTDVGHLSDDWVILDHVHREGNAGAWAGSWLDLSSMRFHRPFSTELFAWDLALFGADPKPAHILHLCWHVASVLLLCIVLRQMGLDWRASVLASALFLCHPVLPETTAWLSARTGLVAGTLTLATLAAHQAAKDKRHLPLRTLALIAAGTAALSRENGYFALVLPLLYDLLVARPRQSTATLVRRHAAFALLGFALLALRYRALGTLVGGYGHTFSADRPPLHEELATFGRGLAASLRGLPIDLADDPTEGQWSLVLALIALSFGALCLVGSAWISPRWQSLCAVLGIDRARAFRLIAFACAAIGLQASILVVSGADYAFGTSQRWYVILAIVCALLGATASGSWLRSALLVALIAIGWLPQAREVQAEMIAADAEVRAIVASGERMILDRDPAVDRVFLSGLPLGLMQWGTSSALRPPFRAVAPDIPIYPVHRFMALDPTGDGLGASLPGIPILWPFHPPIEILLFGQGHAPLALNLDPKSKTPLWSEAGPYQMTQGFGSREAVAQGIAPAINGGHFLALRAEPSALFGRRPPEVILTITAAKAGQGELFTFLETYDARRKVTWQAGENVLRLGPEVSDYLAFRRGPNKAYVIATFEGEGRTVFASPPLEIPYTP